MSLPRSHSASSFAFALALLCAAPQLAQAQALNPRAMGMRMTDAVLRAVGDAAPAIVPAEIELPEIERTLVDCPVDLLLDDIVVRVGGGTVRPRLRSVDLWFETAVLRLDMLFDLEGTVRFEGGDDPGIELCGLPDVRTCDAALSTPSARIALAIELWNDDGQLGVRIADELQNGFVIDISPAQTQLELAHCGIADELFNLFYNAFRETLVSTLVSTLNESLPGTVNTLVRDLIAGFLPLSGQIGPLIYRSSFDELLVQEGQMTVWMDAGLEAAVTECVPATTRPPAPEPELPATLDVDRSSGMAMAVSRSFLNQVIHAVWQSGLMCISSEDFGEVDLAGLVGDALPGVPPGALLSYRSEVPEEPTLQLLSPREQGDASAMQLSIPSILLHLALRAPDVPSTEVSVGMSADASLGLQINPNSGDLELSIREMEPDRIELNNDGGTSVLALNACSLETLVENVLLPRFGLDTGPLPLLSGRRELFGLAMSLDAVEVVPPYMNAYLDAFGVPEDDAIAPETVLRSAPRQTVSADDAIVEMESWDDKTPPALVRHVFRVDDGPWSEVVSSQVLRIPDLETGVHIVDIAAEDLSGNRDDAPARVELTVDATPPEILFTRRPRGLQRDTRTQVVFRLRDGDTDPQQLSYEWKLYQLTGACARDLPALATGQGVGGEAVDLIGLPEGGHVVFEVTATDVVGNRAIERTGFAINSAQRDPFGCQSATPAAPLLLLPFALLWLRRRARR